MSALSQQRPPPHTQKALTSIQKLTGELPGCYQVVSLSEVGFFFMQEVFGKYLISKGRMTGTKKKGVARHKSTVATLPSLQKDTLHSLQN